MAGESRRRPVFMPLAAYDDHLRRTRQDTALSDFLAAYYERWHNLPGLVPLFRQALAVGEALVLLDGLDEVLDVEMRRFVAGQVDGLIRRWLPAGNRFALSSRIVGYRETPLSSRLPHVTIVDFGPAEVKQFATQWCLAYELWLAGRDSEVARQRAATETRELLREIRSNSSLKRLAASPLLITMLAPLRRHVGKLPDRRIELYERYTRTLIDNWEVTRSYGARQQQRADRFDPHQAIAHLMELALLIPLLPHRPTLPARLLPWLGCTFEHRSVSETIRRQLAAAFAPLLAQDEGLRRQVVAMLDSPAWPARLGAAWALIGMPGGPPPALLPRLKALLEDFRAEESWPQRLQVAEILLNHRDPALDRRAIEVALAALDYATQPWYNLPHSGAAVRRIGDY